nr:glycoside hydrolase family 3 C-terminal domain-containing protein [Prevotella sp.]
GTWTDGLKNGKSNAYDGYYLADPYIEGIKSGKYTTKQLDDKARRVLRLFFRTTMNKEREFGLLCSESHYTAAREIAEDGIVLLQNKGNILPINITGTKKILVVGENAIKMMTVGGGSSSLKVQHETLPLEGLKKRLGDSVQVDYERGYVGDVTGEYNGVTTKQNLKDSRSASQLISDAVEKAKSVDYVIFFGGLNKSNYQDSEGHDRKSYDLPYNQDAVIETLLKVNKNVVYVNISGNAVAMPWKERVPAIVQGWFLGSEAGDALASVLVGDVNPSGKLPFTWYSSLSEVGAHSLNSYPGTWRSDHKIIDEDYKEGIYVGYRWTDKNKIKPLFSFGHGMSYTSFKMSNLRKSSDAMTKDGKITFTVTVANTGKRTGAEVVQLYVHDVKSSVDRPYKELKGFKKVALCAGEKKDVSITIDNSSLSFYDEKNHVWTSEEGDFDVLIGNSSDNLSLKTSFKLL